MAKKANQVDGLLERFDRSEPAETKAQQECPYCHESKVIVGDSDLQANVMIHLGSLFIVPKIIKPMGNVGSGQGISYCPMCGRKVDVYDC